MKMPLQLFICLLAGALITPSLSPFNLNLLALLPPAILYLLCKEVTAQKGLWLGWAFGLGFFGTGVSWVFVSIYEHSPTPMLGAIALTTLFSAALGLLFSAQIYIWRRLFIGAQSWLSFIGLWLLFEWLRSWLFTGFPWLYLGYAALDTPLSSLFPIGGVWLASLAVLVISLPLTVSITQRKPALLLVAALPILISAFLPGSWTKQSDKTLRVTLIQPNIPQRIKWNPSYQPEIFNQYQSLSLQNLQTDLLLWPETAIPALLQNAAPSLNPLFERIDQQGITLISGLPSTVSDPSQPKGYRIHNSLAVLTNGSGIYHKQRLVPFGEYLPFESYLRGVLAFFNLPMSSFSLPLKAQQHIEVQGIKISTAICYEIAYPELVRKNSTKSGFILTVSNDTWFGRSIAPAQHMQIARARALENGRWLIRGTNNGISAIVNPRGDITKQLPQYQSGILNGTIHEMQGTTPYQKYGVIPALCLALLMLLTSVKTKNREAKSKLNV